MSSNTGKGQEQMSFFDTSGSFWQNLHSHAQDFSTAVEVSSTKAEDGKNIPRPISVSISASVSNVLHTEQRIDILRLIDVMSRLRRHSHLRVFTFIARKRQGVQLEER